MATSRGLDDGEDTIADRGGKSGPRVNYAGQLRVGRRGFSRKCCALCCAFSRNGRFLGVFGVFVWTRNQVPGKWETWRAG